jgi:hypothetical protein
MKSAYTSTVCACLLMMFQSSVIAALTEDPAVTLQLAPGELYPVSPSWTV